MARNGVMMLITWQPLLLEFAYHLENTKHHLLDTWFFVKFIRENIK